MARSHARLLLDRRRVVRRQFAILDGHIVDQDLIDAEIGNIQETVIRREDDLMGVWALLAIQVHARTSGSGQRFQSSYAPVALQMKSGNAARHVISHDEKARTSID